MKILHFDAPFRFAGSTFATVEQDTDEDIAASVYSILQYRPGQRELDPTFGIPSPLYQNVPVATDQIRAAIIAHEPRAAIKIDQQPDAYDPMITRISVEISITGGSDA